MSVSEGSGVLSKALFLVLVACAVFMTVITYKRQYSNTGTGNRNVPVEVSNWRDYAKAGHRIGPDLAPVTVVEFADFQCPACRAFHLKVLRPVTALFPGQVTLIFRHFPLQYHPQALPSVRVAECAAVQGRFEQMANLLYEKQDSLGIKAWSSFAMDAGVPDMKTFGECSTQVASIAAVAVDTVAGNLVGIKGTPTILVNGLKFAGAPDSAAFERAIREALEKLR